MNISVVIDLITLSTSVSDSGDPINTKTYASRYASKKSIRQSEFYQASAVGLIPELMFEIRSIDYANQKKLRYSSKEYEIIRAYDKGEFVELICQGVVNG